MMSDETTIGGGTGGGTGMDDDGNNLQSAKSTYQIAGNQVVLLSRKPPPPDKAGPSVITILAGGGLPTFDDDGKVDVRGTKGVRITAGPPIRLAPLTSPPVTDPATNGVEIIVAESQKITIQRGSQAPPPFQSSFQKIEMTPDGIALQSGASPTSFSKIEMKPYSITGDMHTCPMTTGPVPHVGGPILPPGCPTVLIGGMPAARKNDMTAHGGIIVMGWPTVLIGP